MRQLFVMNSAWIGVRLVVTRPPLFWRTSLGFAVAAAPTRDEPHNDLKPKPSSTSNSNGGWL